MLEQRSFFDHGDPRAKALFEKHGVRAEKKHVISEFVEIISDVAKMTIIDWNTIEMWELACLRALEA